MNAPSRRLALGTLGIALLLAACGSVPAAAVTPSPPPAVSLPPDDLAPTPVPVPSPPGGSAGSGGGSAPGGGAPGPGGGAVPGNPGNGGAVDPGAGGAVPDPQPTIVTPAAGVAGIHDVGATRLHAAVNGRRVSIQVAWWSGVEPCSVLAEIGVARDGSTFTLTVREGSVGAGVVACIEIAMYKAAIVDLGDLDPGTYTVRAFGDAPPVEVIVAP